MRMGLEESGMADLGDGGNWTFYHGINIPYHRINQAVAAPKVRHALIQPRTMMGS